MDEAGDAAAFDLSGAWQGLFSYPRKQPPVSFAATLSESGGWLTGTTQETGSVGDAKGLTISATIQGGRSGRSVTFLKTYDASFKHYDSVHYAGEVNADGTEIEGQWTVPGNWSGTFLMIRSSGPGAALALETTAKA